MSKKTVLWMTIGLLLALSLVLTMAACGTSTTTTSGGTGTTMAGAGGKVGVVLPTRDEPRWLQDEARFKQLFEAAGYEIQILFSQGDSAIEKTNVQTLISQGVEVIILCPQDGTAAAAAAQEARDAGVKMIAYDRLILDTAAVDFIVTFDQQSVGTAQGQYLVDHATGSGNPLYLYAGAASDNNAFLFFEGAWEVLQPKIADGTFVIKNSAEAVAAMGKATLTHEEQAAIIGKITTDWKPDVAKNVAEANLTSTAAADKGDVFILAPNDGTARAIADSFRADADVKSLVITGQDVEKASVQYIIDGKQSMSVFKDTRALTEKALTVATAFLTGGTPETNFTINNNTADVLGWAIPVVVVEKANIKAALIDTGYYTAADFTGL